MKSYLNSISFGVVLGLLALALMAGVSLLGPEIKIYFRLLRGWRICRNCSRWTSSPHTFKGRHFCGRICAARFESSREASLDQRAREAGS